MHFLRTESVFSQVPIKQRCGVDGHRAVQKNRQAVWNFTRRLELRNGVQYRLRTPDRKHRHDGHAAASGELVQQGAKFCKQFFFGVLTVSVSGLNQHRVGLRRRLGRVHERIVWSAQIAREQNASARHIEQQTGRAQNVSSRLETRFPAANGFKPLPQPFGMQLFQAVDGFLFGVERQGRCMFGKTMPVGKKGIFFLNVAAVGQQDGGQVAGARCGMDSPAKTFLDQQRQVPAVVQVSMCQDHGIDLIGDHWQGAPVAQAQLFVTLEQSAIDQQTLAVVFNQVFGAGDSVSSAEEGEGGSHVHHGGRKRKRLFDASQTAFGWRNPFSVGRTFRSDMAGQGGQACRD